MRKRLFDDVREEVSYKTLIENHPARILILDGAGNIVDFNGAAVRFYGYETAQLLTMQISDINTYSREQILSEMRLAKLQKRNYFKFVHRCSDGAKKHVFVISYPVVYKGGEYLFSVIDEVEPFLFNTESPELNALTGNSAEAMMMVTEHQDAFTRREKLIKEGFKNAIQNNELVLFGQPIVDIKRNEISGVEILIRWYNDALGWVMPGDFIPYAELTGQITELDLWVLRNSFDFILNHGIEDKAFKYHVNLSATSLQDGRIACLFDAYKDKHIFDRIVIELTEESNADVLTQTFADLKKMGISFAMDDFGAGYSSFRRIRDTGVDCIKIDRSLVSNITELPEDIVILKSILQMCNNLHIDVIAEGVEEVEQLEYLIHSSCREVQGYLLIKPRRLEDLLADLTSLNQDLKGRFDCLQGERLYDPKFYNDGRVFAQEVSKEHRLINPNMALVRLLKYPLGDLKDLNFLDFLSKEGRTTYKEAVAMVLEKNESFSVTTTLYTFEGDRIRVICAMKKLGEHRIKLYIEIMDNEDEEKKNLIGLSQCYIEAFYNATMGMMIVSTEDMIVKSNDAAKKMFALRDTAGMDIHNVFSNRHQKKVFMNFFNKVKMAGQNCEVIEFGEGDERRYYQWDMKKICGSAKACTGYIAIQKDISNEKRLERLNAALTKKLETLENRG